MPGAWSAHPSIAGYYWNPATESYTSVARNAAGEWVPVAESGVLNSIQAGTVAQMDVLPANVAPREDTRSVVQIGRESSGESDMWFYKIQGPTGVYPTSSETGPDAYAQQIAKSGFTILESTLRDPTQYYPGTSTVIPPGTPRQLGLVQGAPLPGTLGALGNSLPWKPIVLIVALYFLTR